MKKFLSLLCILLTASLLPVRGASDTFVDYQNFDHGYCPECNCFPCQCALLNAVDEDVPPPPVPPPPPPPDEEEEEDEPDSPCDPAPVCATNCGIGLCWIGLGIAVIATTAAIIVSSNNGSPPTIH